MESLEQNDKRQTQAIVVTFKLQPIKSKKNKAFLKSNRKKFYKKKRGINYEYRLEKQIFQNNERF